MSRNRIRWEAIRDETSAANVIASRRQAVGRASGCVRIAGPQLRGMGQRCLVLAELGAEL